jgi:hypothetical protein
MLESQKRKGGFSTWLILRQSGYGASTVTGRLVPSCRQLPYSAPLQFVPNVQRRDGIKKPRNTAGVVRVSYFGSLARLLLALQLVITSRCLLQVTSPAAAGNTNPPLCATAKIQNWLMLSALRFVKSATARLTANTRRHPATRTRLCAGERLAATPRAVVP